MKVWGEKGSLWLKINVPRRHDAPRTFRKQVAGTPHLLGRVARTDLLLGIAGVLVLLLVGVAELLLDVAALLHYAAVALVDGTVFPL